MGPELHSDPMSSPGTQITPQSWSYLYMGLVLLRIMSIMGKGYVRGAMFNLPGKVASVCMPKDISLNKVKTMISSSKLSANKKNTEDSHQWTLRLITHKDTEIKKL